MTYQERAAAIKRAEGLITEAQSLIDRLHEDAIDTGYDRKAALLGALSDALDDARTACGDVVYEAPLKPEGASPLAFALTDPKLSKKTRKKLIAHFDQKRGD